MIDFKPKDSEFSASEAPQKKKKKGKIIGLVFLGLIIFIVLSSCNRPSTSNNEKGWLNNFFWGSLSRIIGSDKKELKGESDDRINILLLGMGGKGHDGAYLTDTIMLVSLRPSDKKVALLSIPRDTVVPIKGYGWRKINNINAYAEAEDSGSGGKATIDELSSILEIPIQYYFRADFDGFINMIDKLGGIEVNVEKILDDPQYPILGQEENPDYPSRFEHLYVEKGLQKMDGSLALKFARSRHGLNGEGSDFARSRRQQLVLEAVKEKLLSAGSLLNPVKIFSIAGDLKEHVSTNLEVSEGLRIWEMFKDINKEDIINKVLDDGPKGLLSSGRGEDGAYILQPRSGNFTEIQTLVKNIFAGNAEIVAKQESNKQHGKVEIINGTYINKLASRISFNLQKQNFTITKTGNAQERNVKKTVIYDLTYGEKLEDLKVLKDNTDAEVSINLPNWLISYINESVSQNLAIERPDFILVLGEDCQDKNY